MLNEENSCLNAWIVGCYLIVRCWFMRLAVAGFNCPENQDDVILRVPVEPQPVKTENRKSIWRLCLFHVLMWRRFHQICAEPSQMYYMRKHLIRHVTKMFVRSQLVCPFQKRQNLTQKKLFKLAIFKFIKTHWCCVNRIQPDTNTEVTV